MQIQIKSFFVTFTSRCIQAADCTKIEDALVKARALVGEQEQSIDSFLKNFIKEWSIDLHGLTIITKPIKHVLFYDKDSPTHYAHWPHNKRNNTYDVGSATIQLPIESLNPVIHFDNSDFVHGHLTDRKINCWGKYENIQKTVLHGGPIAAISAMYGFCKYSRYGTYLRSQPQEPSNV